MSNVAATQNVLIVEDYGLVRAGMRALLERAAPHYAVFEEGTYEGAIDLLLRVPFELVFLDIDLGASSSGLDILRFIRDRELACRAVMLSASDDRDTVMSCVSQGASGFITKAGGDEGVFEQAIETVLAEEVYLPNSIVKRADFSPGQTISVGCSAESLGLARRQCEVLYYLCQGLPNKSIASRMNISEGTVRKSYVSELLSFFGVSRRTELIIEVSRRRLKLTPPPK